MIPRVTRLLVSLASVSLLTLPTGCGSAQPKRLLDDVADAQLDEAQIRVATQNYVRRFRAVVANAANEIMARSDDPDTRKKALVWKTQSITACHSALIKVDSLAAFMDIWALTAQQREFLDEGPGSDLFGELQPIAVDASRKLEHHGSTIAESIAGADGAENGAKMIREWADEHPVDDITFTREYPRQVIEEWRRAERPSALGAVQSIEERLAVYSELAPVMLEFMPRQLRWQLELLVDDYLSRRDVADIEENVDRIADAAVGIQGTTDELNDLVDKERVALVAAVDQQREELAKTIDAQRVAVTEAVDRQRQETLEVVHRERVETMAAIDEQRRDTLDDLRGLLADTGDKVEPRLLGLIDHFFLRAAQLGGVLAVLTVLAVALGFWISRRPRRHQN